MKAKAVRVGRSRGDRRADSHLDVPRDDAAGGRRGRGDRERVNDGGDAALRELTARFDATEQAAGFAASRRRALTEALDGLDSGAARGAGARDRQCARCRRRAGRARSEPGLAAARPVVELREVPVAAAGIYAPGGRAAYPSSVLMGAVPARVAGVERVGTGHATWTRRRGPATRPRHRGRSVRSTRSTRSAARRRSSRSPTAASRSSRWTSSPGRETPGCARPSGWSAASVGIDSLAGPSELMLVAGHDTDPEWAALDLCAQAEHGGDGPLIAVAVEQAVLDAIEAADRARSRPSDRGSARRRWRSSRSPT